MDDDVCSPMDGLFSPEHEECKKCQREARKICALRATYFRDFAPEELIDLMADEADRIHLDKKDSEDV